MAEPIEITVVLVDDEEMVLTSLRSFLTLETEYAVRTFTTPKEALQYIQENEVDIVLSDYLMPEMDGITFLGEVRRINPKIPRIILTGYADKENAIKAINDIKLFQYIEKPWDNNDLLLVLRNGIERKRLMDELERLMDELMKERGEKAEAKDDYQALYNQILKTFA